MMCYLKIILIHNFLAIWHIYMYNKVYDLSWVYNRLHVFWRKMHFQHMEIGLYTQLMITMQECHATRKYKTQNLRSFLMQYLIVFSDHNAIMKRQIQAKKKTSLNICQNFWQTSKEDLNRPILSFPKLHAIRWNSFHFLSLNLSPVWIA